MKSCIYDFLFKYKLTTIELELLMIVSFLTRPGKRPMVSHSSDASSWVV